MRTIALALAMCALLLTGAAEAAPTHDFKVALHSYAFGQAPDWLGMDEVVFQDDATGKNQVYRANLDGSRKRCLTCTLDAGPNQVPQVRPQQDWVLFHTFHGKALTVGGAGYGGIGTELYIMRPDGSQITRLTVNSEGKDDYHAYWSPDGTKLVWTHLDWNFITEHGEGKWDIRVADFSVAPDGTPKLGAPRVVRPANGHFYETQHWAPDGSGFLYTESVDNSINLELFSCRLTATGCETRRLTHDEAWDEQAIYTPDMKRVIFMSTRDHPGAFSSFASLSAALGLPPDADNVTVLPIFEIGFLQPVLEQANDLYELDLKTQRVRRLTDDGDDGWVSPEFVWDPAGKRLMWTELKWKDEYRIGAPLNLQKELTEGPSTETPQGNMVRRTRIAHYAVTKVKPRPKRRTPPRSAPATGRRTR